MRDCACARGAAAGGLRGGEQVVVAGVHVLTEGQKVTRYSPQPVMSPSVK